MKVQYVVRTEVVLDLTTEDLEEHKELSKEIISQALKDNNVKIGYLYLEHTYINGHWRASVPHKKGSKVS